MRNFLCFLRMRSKRVISNLLWKGGEKSFPNGRAKKINLSNIKEKVFKGTKRFS